MKLDKEKFDRAKILEALIRTEKLNIKNWEKLFEADEIVFSSKTKPQQMYLTGKTKNEVKDVILKSHKEFLDKNEREFEEL